MKRPCKRILIASLLVLAAFTFVPVAAGEATTVIVVRHAEKMTDSSDPSLSMDGKVRAATLGQMLADVELSAILSTPFKRTTGTVAGIAKARGLEVTITPIDDGLAKHVEDIARRIKEDHAGGAVLVVGHSNTVPAIVGALGIDGVSELTEKDYDDLFVVNIDESGVAHLMHLHYGEVSP
jgi:broad specificity phosphatase PhoE